MTAIDRVRAAVAFKAYTDAYDAANPRIALKIEHTYHVAEACDAVAREQGWSPQDIDLAWLCGLLHDMGRFEQLRRWDTFKDAESMSHAALGVEVLFGENPADARQPDGDADERGEKEEREHMHLTRRLENESRRKGIMRFPAAHWPRFFHTGHRAVPGLLPAFFPAGQSAALRAGALRVVRRYAASGVPAYGENPD